MSGSGGARAVARVALAALPPLAGALAAVLALAALLAVAAVPAGAVSSPTPWDGKNPFHCQIQNAGKGTQVPHPDADPYCVSFDKTNQNVTQLGLITFLSLEPARVAAAGPKCFYFQEDHWRGSVVQSDGSTVLYEFYGHYFFNKATGDGGAWVTDFSVGGRTFDPSSLPGFPPGYGQYFGPGTGGFITHDDIPADASCAAKAKASPGSIYATTAPRHRCLSTAGRVTRTGIGRLNLGQTEARVRALIGSPQTVRRGFLRYCVARGGTLLVGQPGDRSGTYGSDGRTRTVMLITTSPRSTLRGRRGIVIHPGSRAAAVRRALPGARRVGRLGGVTLWRRGDLIVAIAHRRVRYLAVYRCRSIRTRAALKGYLRRAA